MLPHPLQMERSEKLPESSNEFEMYSVRFVLSVASRRIQDRTEGARNRSLKHGAQGSDSPSSATPPAPNSLRGWQLD